MWPHAHTMTLTLSISPYMRKLAPWQGKWPANFTEPLQAELGFRSWLPKHNTLHETKRELERGGVRRHKSEEEEKCYIRQKRLKGIPYVAKSQATKKPQQHSLWIRVRDASWGVGKGLERGSIRLLQLPRLDPLMSPTLSALPLSVHESTCHRHSAGMDRLLQLRVWHFDMTAPRELIHRVPILFRRLRVLDGI